MLNFSRMPLRWRLTLLITLICTLTLGAAFGGYFALEVLRLQDDVAKNSQEFASQLAVSVSDTISSGAEITASDWRQWLTSNDPIVAVVVYSPTGRVISSYIRPGVGASIGSLRSAYMNVNFSTDEAIITRKLVGKDNHRFGTLVLTARATEEARFQPRRVPLAPVLRVHHDRHAQRPRRRPAI